MPGRGIFYLEHIEAVGEDGPPVSQLRSFSARRDGDGRPLPAVHYEVDGKGSLAVFFHPDKVEIFFRGIDGNRLSDVVSISEVD